MKKILFLIALCALGLSFVGLGQMGLDSGSFFFQLNEDAGLEDFALTQEPDGNLKLVSNFQALSEQLIFDFGTDKLFTQTILFTKDLELISYEARSETERGKTSITVTVKNSVASMHVISEVPGEPKEERQRDIILEDNVITTGIAASQFLLMQTYINQKLDLAVGKDVLLTAFDPTNINEPLVELTVERRPDVIVEDVKTHTQFRAHRYAVTQDEFDAEIISCSDQKVDKVCSEPDRFLGFISSTASLAGVELDNAGNNGGAVVVSVAEGSFAAQAGLKAGDIIKAVDGDTVNDRRDLNNEIRFKNPSVPVKLTVSRGGQTLEIEVRLSGSFLTVFRFDLFEGGFTILGEA